MNCGCIRAQSLRGLVSETELKHHGRGAHQRSPLAVGRRAGDGKTGATDKQATLNFICCGPALPGSGLRVCACPRDRRDVYILEERVGPAVVRASKSLALVALHREGPAVRSMAGGGLSARAVLLWVYDSAHDFTTRSSHCSTGSEETAGRVGQPAACGFRLISHPFLKAFHDDQILRFPEPTRHPRPAFGSRGAASGKAKPQIIRQNRDQPKLPEWKPGRSLFRYRRAGDHPRPHKGLDAGMRRV